MEHRGLGAGLEQKVKRSGTNQRGTMAIEKADILIVGGGPVGLTLAAELSYHGIDTILIEKKPNTSDTPKAVFLSSRTMEHFRRMGIEKKIQEASMPRDLPVAVMFGTGAYAGNIMFRQQCSSWGEIVDGVAGAKFPFFQEGSTVSVPMLCPQFTSEAVIRKHIEDTSQHVKMFWGWCVTSLSQDDSSVTVEAVNQGGEKKTFRAQYLAACDGGRSPIHKMLGLQNYGQFVVSKACTIRFSSPRLLEHMLAAGTAGFSIISNSKFTAVFVLLNGEGEFATHIIIPSTASDEEVEGYVQNPASCIESVLGSSECPFEVISVSGYNMHALLSTKFREGRCFFAGDSAHQWLPAGGLGLNTGISDVADLSWKLAAMIKGHGGKFLMDSYEVERKPLDDLTRRFAMSFGGAVIDSRPMAMLRSFMLTNPITRFVMGRVVGKGIVSSLNSGIGIVLGFQYSNSTIVLHQYNEDGSVRLHCAPQGTYLPTSLPGCRAPHVILPGCPSILDLFGRQFVILVIGGAESDLKELQEVMTKRGVSFGCHTYPLLPDLIELYNRKYFLIRPDGVVAWRSDYQPSSAESTRIVDTVLGHTHPSRLPQPTNGRPDAAAGVSWVYVAKFWTHLFLNCAGLTFASECLVVGATLFLQAVGVYVSSPDPFIQSTSRHKAALISKYGTADSVLKVEPRHVGSFGPCDVLIRVHASSVTALDVLMRMGLGSNRYQGLFRLSGLSGPYFPRILGRDCSGEVVAVGDSVTKFLPGDQVYAAIPPHRQGANAQLVAVDEHHAAFKPTNVDHKEAASLPWVAVTTWTALVKHAGVNQHNARGKRVLVHQGTGGVGSFAVQLLKSWGASVATTCSVEDTVLAHHLGADKVVEIGDVSSVLSGYDVVLDTVGGKFEQASLSTLKCYNGSVYVSLQSPSDKLVGSFGGLLGGVLFSTLYRCKVLYNRLVGGRAFYYSSTEIDAECLEQVGRMVEQGAVRPLIDAVYSLDEVIDAHKHIETGNTRGKVVISIP